MQAMQVLDTKSASAAPPLVTIIVPSFNHEVFVQAALMSAVAQDYPNIELIVIDDGSSDNSVARIQEMAERCTMRFVRFEFRARPNLGLCQTLNEGIEWAQGDYLSVLDSDDILLPAKTSTLVSLIGEDEGLAGVFGGCSLIDEKGAVLSDIRPRERTYCFGDILSRDKALISSSMLVRLEDVRRVGGYKVGLYIEDWYMWLKLTEGGALLKVIPEPLVKYRQHGANISGNARKMFEGRCEILRAYPGHPQVPLALSSIWIQLAADLARNSKLESLRCAYKSLCEFPRMSTYRFFWMTIARAVAPNPVLSALSAWKHSARKRTIEARAGG